MRHKLLTLALLGLMLVDARAQAQFRKPTPAISCGAGYHPECVPDVVPTPTKTVVPPTPTKIPPTPTRTTPPTVTPTLPPPTAIPTSPPPTVVPTIPVPIDAVKPTVKILDPQSAQKMPLGSKYLTEAEASDDVGVVSVEYKVYGTAGGCTATVAPWSCDITLPATGTVSTITAIAKDAAGNQSSHEVNVYLVVSTMPTPEPTIVLTPSPAPTVAPPTPGPTPTAAPTYPPSAGMPAPIQNEVDVTLPGTPSKWWKPINAGELQQALDAVAPGEGIELQAGTHYIGNFKIRPKATVPAGLVTRALGAVIGATAVPLKVWIRSSGYAQLPPQGTRAGSGEAQTMATIVSPNYLPAIAFIGPASNYYLSGVEITTTLDVTTTTNYGLVAMGFQDPQGYDTVATSLDQLPDQVVFDRVYVHGTLTGNVRRGITINSRAVAVIDSTIKEIHEVGSDNQAIGGWNGAGPFLIRNSWLEASCENFMMGGADTSIPGNSPSDMVFENNLVTKDFRWRINDPAYAGIRWSVKNLFELKHMKRARIRFNVFDRWWADGQAATMQITPRNSNNTNPQTTIQDIEFTYNRVGRDNFGSFMNFMGGRSTYTPAEGGPTQRTSRILIENNLIEKVEGFAFQVLSGPVDVKIQHNTVMMKDGVGNTIGLDGTPPAGGFVFANNIIGAGNYFIYGNATGVGDVSIAKYAPDMTLVGNAFYGPWPTPGGATPDHIKGHPGNFFPANRNLVGFVDLAGGNYALSSNSPYKGKASDGQDVGVVDMNKLPR